MDDAQKQMLKAELSVIKGSLSAASGHAAALNQTTFAVTGPTVVIAVLPQAAQAFRLQADAIDKLVNLVEKVINAS